MTARYTPKGQRGWALLEATVTTALLALLIVLIVSMLQGVRREAKSDDPMSILTQGQLALTGYALLHHQFPAPDDAHPSPGRPHYLEGWLPAGMLGLTIGDRRIRYLVHDGLVTAPPIYNADPMNLTGGQVVRRTQAGTIDFCASLLQKELAQEALPDGRRAAFALQQASSSASGALISLPQMWLGGSEQGNPSTGRQLHTVQRGFTEIATQLRCFQQLDETTRNVKAAGAAKDMLALAEQEILRNQLALNKLHNSINSLGWRIANRSLDIGVATERGALTAIDLFTIPETTPIKATALIRKTLYAGLLGAQLGILSRDLSKASGGVSDAENAVGASRAYAEQVRQEVLIYVAAANRAQNGEDKP